VRAPGAVRIAVLERKPSNMQMTRWASCLWPGLPQLWRGSWSGLVLAMTFGVLLNVVLVTSFGWTELVAPAARATSWAVLAAFWAVATAVSYRAIGRPRAEPEEVTAEGDLLLVEAQGEYLRGNWLDAERLLRQLLRNSNSDVDARLMLATLLRHTRRLDEARLELDRLERLEDAAKWRHEIEQERRQVERIESTSETGNENESQQSPQTHLQAPDAENQYDSLHVVEQAKSDPPDSSATADAA